MNRFDQMVEAVDEAENQIRVVDRMTERLARMLIGRLRKVDSTCVLADLKKELSEFNAHTKKWKS